MKAGALAMAFVFATQVSAAQRAGSEAAAAEGSGSRRGAPFWTGVGLLAGGLGLAAFAATQSHHCGDMMGEGCAMAASPDAMRAMMEGMHPGIQWSSSGAAAPPLSFGAGTSHSMDHGGFNAVAIGVGVAAATAGLVIVLVSHKDGRPGPSVTVRPGLGRMDVAFSF
jgi:hypothetical protein